MTFTSSRSKATAPSFVVAGSLLAGAPERTRAHPLAGPHPLARAKPDPLRRADAPPLARGDAFARPPVKQRARSGPSGLRCPQEERLGSAPRGPFAGADPHALRATKAPSLTGSTLRPRLTFGRSDGDVLALEPADELAIHRVAPSLGHRRG